MNDDKLQAEFEASATFEPELAAAFDMLSEAYLEGTEDDFETLLKRFPNYADQLRPMLSTLQTLAGSAHSDAVNQSPLNPAFPNQTLGDYRILREVGRGGMGIVYEAEQISLGRRVALKIVPLATMLDEHHVVRFKNEARAAASFSHPNIVPIHAMGEERGVHYLAMQFIQGRTVADLIESLKLTSPETAHQEFSSETVATAAIETVTAPAQQATLRLNNTPADASNSDPYWQHIARLGQQIADGLEHAHQCGVIHRDIKPSNILLDHQGKAWLTDFGLARLNNESSITRTGDVLGTLRYMSPEQAGGPSRSLDHRSDVYSLGATLYELAALRPLFASEDGGTLLQDVRTRQPKHLTRFPNQIPVQLATIIHKSLQKEPEHRYADAKSMADDLQRFVDGEAIEARAPTIWQRVSTWSNRHRTWVAGAAAAVLALLAVGLLLSQRHAAELAVARQRSDRMYRAAKEDLAVAMSLVDDVMRPILSNSNGATPNLSAEQDEQLSIAINAYLELANRHRGDPSFVSETILAYESAGFMLTMLHKRQPALDALRHALTDAREYVAARPSDIAAKRSLASVNLSLGLTYSFFDDYEQAIPALVEASTALRNRLKAPDHSTSEDLRMQVVALTSLHFAYPTTDQLALANTTANELANMESACESLSHPNELWQGWANSYQDAAKTKSDTGMLRRVLDYLQQTQQDK